MMQGFPEIYFLASPIPYFQEFIFQGVRDFLIIETGFCNSRL
jgi:hypothetical protein